VYPFNGLRKIWINISQSKYERRAIYHRSALVVGESENKLKQVAAPENKIK
jgi:hypothetical protein